MTSYKIDRKTHMSRILFAGLVAATMAGCASQSKPEGYNPIENHQIQVARQQVSVSITLPDQGLKLSPSDERRFHIFLRDFVQRGRSAVMVESQQGQQARDILLANGLRANEVIITTDTTVMAPNAVLSFTANTAVVPECGDWSSNPVFNPSNKPHSNFGCSVQRNIGTIVADPGDFIQAQPSTGGAASRSDESIRIHQSGAPKAPLFGGNAAATQ
ncbi:CpaD family pilus assembly protein [Pseudomonadota bacterium]